MAKSIPPVFQSTFGVYTAVAVIGQGGAGRVFKVHDESGQSFAVKLLDPALAKGDKLKRFKNEIFFCLRNQHAGIITVVDHGLYEDAEVASPFYVMPMYDTSLRTLLNEGIPHHKVLESFSQVLDGVEAAHLRNVVHRDLKPENVLVDRTHNRLVVADFGIARFQEDELRTPVETLAADRLANFQYAAPEQRARGREIDRRADIYALGLILNEMFTGEIIQGTGYRTISSISADNAFLDALVESMVKQAPADRPESVEAIKNALIGRQKDFVTRQRLSELQNTVVPVTDTDDPLVLDPPRLVDVDWRRDQLTLTLSRPVNLNWVRIIKNDVGGPYMSGYQARDFDFAGERASIRVYEGAVGKVVEHFKEWLPLTNAAYERFAREQTEEREAQARKALQMEIEEEDRRARVLRGIQI